jgi:hypothetical protein
MNYLESEATMRSIIKARVLNRIKDGTTEWPSQNHGSDRMALIQVAYDQGWFLEVLN